MAFLSNIPIRRKLITVIMFISGAVLLLTCIAFFAYELITFRQNTIKQFSTLGEVIATNSTAALAFDSKDEAYEILSALKAEKQIVAACLFDEEGEIFTTYPDTLAQSSFPGGPGVTGHQFSYLYLEGFMPVVENDRKLGTLYLKYDMSIIYDRLQLYLYIVLLVIVVSSILAYILSRVMQKGISEPILSMADTADTISEKKDYSVRVKKTSNDELGRLSEAFNQMLEQIEEQNAALSEFNQNLEQKVADRTKELEAANKEMESFSYSVSHDLRAPIRAIDGFLNLFKGKYYENLDDEGKRFIDIIQGSSQRMDILIDDLLEFSRLGRKELNKANTSISSMVAQIWDELSEMEGDRLIELRLGELPDAKVDQTTLRQVWANLISNALKYTRNKEKTIIEIGSEIQKGVTVYYVKDNGAGFNMEYYSKLFGVFQRLHSNRDFEGTGVGLAIVQRIIEKHGGTIWATGIPDKGATFYFTVEKSKNGNPTPVMPTATA